MIEKDNSPGTTEFKSGAVRSSELKGLRYDLISPVALRRLAAAYGEGAEKYSAFNCEKGFPIFGDEGLFTHAFAHLMKFAWGDTTEDHLSHLLWNVAMMCHSQECWPELNAGTSRAELVPAEKRMDAIDRQKIYKLVDSFIPTAEGYVIPGKELEINKEAFLRPEVGVVQEVKPIKPYPHRADLPSDFVEETEAQVRGRIRGEGKTEI